MAAVAVGQISEFQSELESITVYLERVGQYFIANEIPTGRRVAVLLSVIGSRTYSLLRSLLHPEVPGEKTYVQLATALREHFEPKRLVVVERFHFNRRNQGNGESVLEYVAEIKRLAGTCTFGAFLTEALRDRFVCGLTNESIQRRLLSEANLDFEKAVQIARGMETAQKNSQVVQASEGRVQKFQDHVSSRTQGGQGCRHCGKRGHQAEHCRFKNAVCYRCHKKGHIEAKCKTRQDKEETKWMEEQGEDECKGHRYHVIDTLCEETMGSVFKSQDTSGTSVYRVKMEINGEMLMMEIDTGAGVSLISEDTYRKKFSKLQLTASAVRLATYTTQRIEVCGEVRVRVRLGDQEKHCRLVVVAGKGPSLLGRDWLQTFRIQWHQINALVTWHTTGYAEKVEVLVKGFPEVFNDNLGEIHPFKARLVLKEGAQPVFCRPRSVPFAIKEQIETELERLEKTGVICPVKYSEWATPIVPVAKPDRSIRICGDFKITVNSALHVDQYPLPVPEELFATLAGGKQFTKLDLSNAYQQLLLDNDSRKMCTINTHRGLYQYTRLPFGIASAPAIFQKLMDSVLQGMSRTVCYIDDILITGDSEDEHLKNLELVLGRLKTHGITVRKSKCVFMANSVEFLGHRIDAEGLHPLESKIEAMVKVPPPKNVAELKSFLGMVNYYAKFLPNLSTTISPLYTLLKKNSRWQWTEECSQAFLAAKGMLTSSKVLAHYNPKLSLILATDASSYGVGAVLTQVSEEGTERPIAYVSRTLSDAERNYAQIEKEALAIIFGVKRFHVYLYGRKFLLLTDHKPLTTIFGPKTGLPVVAASRLQRWALVLSAYQYDVKFRATEEHGNVDGLSRLPLKGERHEEEETEASIFNMVQIETLPVTAGQLRNKSRQDKELSKVMRYLQNGWPEMVTAELQPYEAKKTELTIENHTLLWGMRVVIPRKLQAKVLSELHQNHPGMSRMKSLARSHVWWPNIDRDIEACVRACECCQAIKQSIPLAPMQPWTWPERPWQRVHVDFAGPFLGKMFFLLMNAHSKWPEVYEMTSTTAQKTVDILRHIFAAYGLPEQLVSDNGPQFVAKEFEDFMLKNGIRHIRSAPYHPATNGLVERFVQSFKRAMETGKNSGQTLQHRLSSFLLAYRSSPHSVTNVSPCSLFLQRELRTKLDLLRQTTEQIVRKKQEEQKEGHDKNTRERVFEQNDIVWASNFGVGERWVKGKIKQSSGPSSYLVELADGREWRRHIDHLRRAEGGVRKTEGIKSEIDDQQMMQPDKEVINKEKRAVEPAPEEAGEVQIDQDETPTEVEENEDKTMERKPEVSVARHQYQLRQNRRPPDRY
eukprot:Em0011g753a